MNNDTSLICFFKGLFMTKINFWRQNSTPITFEIKNCNLKKNFKTINKWTNRKRQVGIFFKYLFLFNTLQLLDYYSAYVNTCMNILF